MQIFSFSYLLLVDCHIGTTKHSQNEWITFRYNETFDRLTVFGGNSDALKSVRDIRRRIDDRL